MKIFKGGISALSALTFKSGLNYKSVTTTVKSYKIAKGNSNNSRGSFGGISLR